MSTDPIALTRKLLSFNTINPPGSERECAQYLGKILEDSGFTVNKHEFDDTRASLVASSDGGARVPICFAGHIDTVPLGKAQWSVDPFRGEIDGDRIYGRGSSDTKGCLAAMIVSAVTLVRKYPGRASVKLVVTAGEETGCQGAMHLAGKKGALGRAGALVIGEPTSNHPVIAHKGALWVEASTSGVTAHGSMPHMGVNAIYKAAGVIQRLQEYDFSVPVDALLGRPTLNVGTIAGGMNINSVPDRTEIGIDIRSIPGQAHHAIMSDLKAWLGEGVGMRKIMDVPGVSTDPGHEWIRQVYDILTPILGQRPVPKGENYFTDASVLTPAFGNIPTVILGPGELQMAHKTDEYCLISRIQQAIEVYTEIARRWCNL